MNAGRKTQSGRKLSNSDPRDTRVNGTAPKEEDRAGASSEKEKETYDNRSTVPTTASHPTLPASDQSRSTTDDNDIRRRSVHCTRRTTDHTRDVPLELPLRHVHPAPHSVAPLNPPSPTTTYYIPRLTNDRPQQHPPPYRSSFCLRLLVPDFPSPTLARVFPRLLAPSFTSA